jgi:phage-related protein
MNFLGLGFSFGGEDKGLGSTMEQLNAQFTALNANLQAIEVPKSLSQGLPSLSTGLEMPSVSPLPDMGGASAGFEAIASQAAGATETVAALGSAGRGTAGMMGRAAGAMTGSAGAITGALGFVGMATGGLVLGVGAVVGIFGTAAEAALGFAGTMARAIPNAVSQGMAGIRNLNEGINLTNGLEAEAQAAAVSTRALGANMGYTGEALSNFTRRAAGMSMALNIGADTAGKAVRAFDEAETEMRAIGFESAADVARFTEAFGVDADLLRNNTMQMAREFELSTEQIERVMSATVEYGQRSGDVAGSLNGLGETMEHMRQQAALMGTTLDTQELTQHAVSAQALAAAYFEMDQDSGRARASATALSDVLLQNRREMQNMFSGTQDELPQLAQELGIATGDIQGAFQAMQAGPAEFMAGMAQMVQQTSGNAEQQSRLFDFMRARLEGAVGEEQAATMMNFFRTANEGALAAITAVQGATNNLGELGREAHRTGRTMQEMFDRAKEAAQTALRGVARGDARAFLAESTVELRRMGAAMREVGQQEGAMGGLVRAASRVSQLGGLGLLPEQLRVTGMLAGQLGESFGPVFSQLTSFDGLAQTAATGLILFGTRLVQSRVAGESWSESLTRTATEFSGMFASSIRDAGEMITNFAREFGNFDIAGLFSGEGASGGILAPILKAFDEIDFTAIWENLKRGFAQIPWAEMWVSMKESFASLPWAELWEGLKTVGGALWNDVLLPAWEGVWADLEPWLVENAPDILLWLGAAMLAGTAAIVAAILAPVYAIGFALAGILAEWFNGFMEDLGQLGGAIEYVWDTYIKEPIVESMDSAWAHVVDRLMDVKSFFINIFVRIQNHITSVVNRIVSTFTGAFPRISARLAEFASSVSAKFSEIVAGANAIWEGMVTYVSEVFTRVVGVIQGVVASITSVWNGIVEVLRVPWDGFIEWFSEIWTGASEAVSGIISGIGLFFVQLQTAVVTTVTQMVGTLIGMFSTLSTAASGSLGGIMATADELFGNSINTVVGEDMAATQEVITQATQASSDIIEQILYNSTLNTIVSAFRDAYAMVAENSAEFAAGLTEVFAQLGQTIAEQMASIFHAIVQGSIITMEVAQDAANVIIGQLGAIAAAQNALAIARERATTAATPTATPEQEEARARVIEGSDTLRAIHDPNWYSEHYKSQFDRGVREIVTAVRGIQLSNPAAAAGVTQRARDSAQRLNDIGLRTPSTTSNGSNRRQRPQGR